MKKVILFLFLIPVPLFCQVTDNFESGKLERWVESVSGHWKADTTSAISGKYSIHHVFDNSDAGNDQIAISTPDLKPSLGLTKWSFKVKHGYDPSSSNNWGAFLISDNEPSSMFIGGPVNGFVIGVNLSGYDDTLRLWKVRKGVLSMVLNTGINWQNEIGTKSHGIINVERTQTGRWKTNILSSGGILIDSASGVDVEIFDAEWFGIYYKYTSTRDRLFWVDDVVIDGVFYKDREPPEVIKCAINSLYSVDLTLNEEPVDSFFSPANFSLNGNSGQVSSIIKLSPVSARIIFNSPFINKSENNLSISSLCDRSGNCHQDLLLRFSPALAEPGDVVISEIMADPLPSVSLPEKEYLEILNRTACHFNLKKWKIANDVSEAIFPEIVINPGEQMILCQLQDTSLFSKYGRVIGLKPFPVLTDAGRLIFLSDSPGNMIHGVEYSSEWYKDNLKSEGGLSLEMIDTEFPFYADGNWSSSISKTGGTPGSTNSLSHPNPDISFKGLLNAFPTDSDHLTISFSEPVSNLAEHAAKIIINETGINSVIPADPLMRKFIIKAANSFRSNQQYSISIPRTVSDFAGNNPDTYFFIFGIPEKTNNGDIVFNEILFNPYPGEADYIEFYNLSSKVINASELLLASRNESGIYSVTVKVSADNTCIMPGTYYTITTDRESLLNRYFSSVKEKIFQVSQLPSMPDDKGHIILFNRQLEIIDEMAYNEKMHYSLLSGYEGISLEKVRPSVLSSDPRNWHSASESSGWGTPGASNSIYSQRPMEDDKIVFSSTRITPDNDGNEDFLVIDLNLGGNDNVVNIRVFDETGGYVCKLANNFLAGSNASITWDGTGDNGSLVNPGIYIILISVFDDSGKTEKWKKICAVVR